jgi:predicted nucleic acid-binding protein
MRVVVADTGPLNYLVLIGESDILPKLFEAVFVPEAALRANDGETSES